MSITVRWTRHFPAWSARHEKPADGSQSWILQAGRLHFRLSAGAS